MCVWTILVRGMVLYKGGPHDLTLGQRASAKSRQLASAILGRPSRALTRGSGSQGPSFGEGHTQGSRHGAQPNGAQGLQLGANSHAPHLTGHMQHKSERAAKRWQWLRKWRSAEVVGAVGREGDGEAEGKQGLGLSGTAAMDGLAAVELQESITSLKVGSHGGSSSGVASPAAHEAVVQVQAGSCMQQLPAGGRPALPSLQLGCGDAEVGVLLDSDGSGSSPRLQGGHPAAAPRRQHESGHGAPSSGGEGTRPRDPTHPEHQPPVPSSLPAPPPAPLAPPPAPTPLLPSASPFSPRGEPMLDHNSIELDVDVDVDNVAAPSAPGESQLAAGTGQQAADRDAFVLAGSCVTRGSLRHSAVVLSTTETQDVQSTRRASGAPAAAAGAVVPSPQDGTAPAPHPPPAIHLQPPAPSPFLRAHTTVPHFAADEECDGAAAQLAAAAADAAAAAGKGQDVLFLDASLWQFLSPILWLWWVVHQFRCSGQKYGLTPCAPNACLNCTCPGMRGHGPWCAAF